MLTLAFCPALVPFLSFLFFSLVFFFFFFFFSFSSSSLFFSLFFPFFSSSLPLLSFFLLFFPFFSLFLLLLLLPLLSLSLLCPWSSHLSLVTCDAMIRHQVIGSESLDDLLPCLECSVCVLRYPSCPLPYRILDVTLVAGLSLCTKFLISDLTWVYLFVLLWFRDFRSSYGCTAQTAAYGSA